MCGIYGIAGKLEPYDRAVFKKMGGLISYRGPDDEGRYYSDNALLGMRRLSIIDLETGNQPIYNEDKTLCIICNGEIYNYKELREELLKKGHKFYTNTDTETILHLYEEFELDFLKHLRGMFAIAIWDQKNERLFLARDRLGKKPLYYLNINEKIIFGSEIKIILSHPCCKKEINFEALSHYFSFKNIPTPLSIFEAIKCLPPASFLNFQKGKANITKYWHLDFSAEVEENETNIADDLLTTLEEAVKLRTYSSDVTVGAYLSGGLDSSLIVGIMSKLCPGRIKTFSLAYKTHENPDIPFAKKISKQFNTEHYEYELSQNEITESLEDIICHFDEPFSGVVSAYFLAKLITKHVKTALSGDGADELFGSYKNHRLAFPIYNYIQSKEKNNLNTVDWQTCRENKDYVIKLAKENIWDWRSDLFVFNDNEKEKLLYLNNQKFQTSKELIKNHFLKSTARDPLNKALEVDIKTLLPDQVLTYADRLSMAYSLEVRSPFLDHIFVEKVAKISGKLKIKGKTTKYILKKMAEKILPEDVIYRAKKGFILPFHEWFKAGMKNYVLTILDEKEIKKIEFLNKNYINEILNEFYADAKDHTYKIWTLLMFVLWYKKYFL